MTSHAAASDTGSDKLEEPEALWQEQELLEEKPQNV